MQRKMLALAAMVLWAAVATAQEPLSTPAFDKGRQILEQTVEALGGEAFLNVTDIDREGRLYNFGRGELASPGEKFRDYVKFPGKEWLELGKDGKIVYLNNGEEGWELDRQGIREQTPEAIANFHRANKRDLEYLLRFRLREEGMQTYYLGMEFVDNRRAHLVELVDGDGESYKLYIDARNYLPMQLHTRRRDPASGERVPEVEYYGKYVMLQGVNTPLQLSRERVGLRTLEVFFDAEKVRYNTGIDDAFFTRENLEQRWEKVKD